MVEHVTIVKPITTSIAPCASITSKAMTLVVMISKAEAITIATIA